MCLFLALAAAGIPARAQYALGVEHKDRIVVVRAASGDHALVEEGGRLIPSTGNKFALKQVDEYLPLVISIAKLGATTTKWQTVQGEELNLTFGFRGEFVSPYKLENVFLVLDIDSEKLGRPIFLREIGALVPYKAKPLSLDLTLSAPLGDAKYQVHVFVNGREALHTMMSPAFIEQTLDQMVARRVKDVVNAAPKPFITPPPEYPKDLGKDSLTGNVVVTFVISPKGRVTKPEVKSETSRAFGEAALLAIRQWRFLPQVREGQAIEAPAELPFDFTPPKS